MIGLLGGGQLGRMMIQAAQTSLVCIPSSALVPDEWATEFWELFGDGAPFSWGDNNVSLITLRRLVDHANKAVDVHVDILLKHRQHYDEWMSLLEEMCNLGLDGLYVDLES